MKKAIPTKEVALRIVAPIAPQIYRAFEHGIERAVAYFTTEKIEPRDPWAFAMIVKLHAREFLRKREEFESVVFDRLSLCGIGFHYQGWTVRLWRSADHDNPKLPHPGRSDSKQRFYVQMELWPENGKTETETEELRVVILWDTNRNAQLETLWLVCPKNFNSKTGEISTYWSVELPNPILAVEKEPESSTAEPLPYKQKEIKKKKEG